MILGDTIVAPATPFGQSGIAVTRISGPLSFPIINRLSKKSGFTNRLATVCSIVDSGGNTIDRCVVTVYKKPSSYTGEDVVEISSHGSPPRFNTLYCLCALLVHGPPRLENSQKEPL